MALVLKALDPTGTERTVASGKPFSMGRGTDNDWVLVDPGREVSKTHCRIEGDDNGFTLVDLSINGVLIEGQDSPMGPGSRHRLAAGDVFCIGRHRFVVATDGSGATAEPSHEGRPSAMVDNILDGVSEGAEQRASGASSGDSERWLGMLPTGSVDETIRQPMGWDQPPSTTGSILPEDFNQPASDFANRSEHVPATSAAIHLPRSQQLIPMDWLDADVDPIIRPSIRAEAPTSRAEIKPVDVRSPFADGARLDALALAGIPDDVLLHRSGEALRSLLDGLDAIEAAQAVAERDCGLPTPTDGGLWTDFFATNRDALISLLGEGEQGPAQVLTQRVSALADRQRALGQAVAEAAERYEARMAPERIEEESKSRFAPGPLAKAAAWSRFVALYEDLAGQGDGEKRPAFLVLLRKSFARAMIRQP